MAFYRRLVSSRPAGCDVKLVVLGPSGRDTHSDTDGYLSENRLAVDGVEIVNFSGLGVSSTPTLVLVDPSSRIVRGAWVGRLSEDQDDKVLSEVRSMCGS
jgi:hypothetical protein